MVNIRIILRDAASAMSLGITKQTLLERITYRFVSAYSLHKCDLWAILLFIAEGHLGPEDIAVPLLGWHLTFKCERGSIDNTMIILSDVLHTATARAIAEICNSRNIIVEGRTNAHWEWEAVV